MDKVEIRTVTVDTAPGSMNIWDLSRWGGFTNAGANLAVGMM